MIFFELFGNGSGEVGAGNDLSIFKRFIGGGDRFFDKNFSGARRNAEGFCVNF